MPEKTERRMTYKQFAALGFLIETEDDGAFGYAAYLKRQGYAPRSYQALIKRGYVRQHVTLSGAIAYTSTDAGRAAFQAERNRLEGNKPS